MLFLSEFKKKFMNFNPSNVIEISEFTHNGENMNKHKRDI